MTATTQNTGQLVGREKAVLLVIFLLSAVGLAYEVILTRLFSLIFQYHYVFLIVSVSIAGLSLGAAIAALSARRPKSALNWAELTYGALILALPTAGVTVFFALLRYAGEFVLPLLVALLPFAGIGFLNASLFARFARSGGILYAADLFGGVCGLIAALIGISWLGALDAIIALGVLCAVGAFVLAWIACQAALRIRTLVVTAILAAVLLGNRATGLIAFMPAALTDAPPDKTMMAVLQEPNTAILETRWDPFARVDVVKTGDDSSRYLFTDAGAGSIMYRFDGDTAKVGWLRQDVAYLPFMVSPDTTKQVLILGAGAGRDVLMARLAGASAITAVEINPSLVELTRAAGDYNGHIFDQPGVQVVVTDGRNFVERDTGRYDLIYANIVYSQAAAPGHSALAESYIFTREALQTYWHHLSDTGRIGFVTHHGIEGLRLVVAGLDMLQREGMTLQQALEHVALVSATGDDPQTRTSVVLITRTAWTSQSASSFADATHKAGAGALYLPKFMEMGLQALTQGTITLDQYITTNTDFNFTPATDDSPFFYQFAPGLPVGLSDLLMISIAIVFLYFSWLIFFFIRDRQHWKRVSLAPYFGVLGAAFLLVEIPLIQRFELLLGQPVLSLVAVAGALLLGGSAGSLFSNRFAVEALPRRIVVFGVLAGLAILATLALYPPAIRAALPSDLAVRFLVSVVLILPLGFLMGVFFPSGLRIAQRVDPQGLAAFWGANAVTSVLGSALAMALAVGLGFSSALILGAVLYLAVASLALLTWPGLLK